MICILKNVKKSLLLLSMSILMTTFASEKDYLEILKKIMEEGVPLNFSNLGDQLGGVSEDAAAKIIKGLFGGLEGGLNDVDGGIGTAIAEAMSKNMKGLNSTLAKTDFDKDIVESINLSLGGVQRGVTNHFLMPLILKNGLAIAGSLAMIATGYYGTKAFWAYMQHRLINPPPKWIEFSSNSDWFYRRAFNKVKGWFVSGPSALDGMIFPHDLQMELEKIANVARNTSKEIRRGNPNVKYSNVLLYGPPGTGKSMFAEKLAYASGMDYVGLKASDFLQPNTGVAKINELFEWAEKSRRGLLIFIDEADIILQSRDILKGDSYIYPIINALLTKLGASSTKFMVVVTTNYMSRLDFAMQRRFDYMIEMPLPEEKERSDVLKLYRDKTLLDKNNDKKFVESVKMILTDEKIDTIAKQTGGLSYGHLSGIINKILIEGLANIKGATGIMIDDVVKKTMDMQKNYFQAQHAPAA